MTRTRRLGAAAALGFAALCLLAPAAAYDAPAADEVVEMQASVEAAPDIQPGRYTLKMPTSTATEYFSVTREIDNSTIWIGESQMTATPVDTYYYVTPTFDGSNQDCGDGRTFESHTDRHDFIGGSIYGSGDCRTSSRVTFGHQGWDPSKVPDGESRLVVWEEPPVTDASILPPPAIKQRWRGTEPASQGTAELGSTFEEAPELVDGRWQVHIDPGRTALFKVPLDWGQHVQVLLTYEGEDAADNVLIKPILINPLGGVSEWGEAVDGKNSDAPSFPDIDLKYASLDGGVVSPSITWRNREKPGVTAAFPGTYYVLLRMGEEGVPKQGADITLSTQVVTDKAPQSPYAQDADPIPALDGSDAEEEEADDQKDSSSSGSSKDETPWPAVGGLFGGSAVMAVLGFLALAKHRRSRA